MFTPVSKGYPERCASFSASSKRVPRASGSLRSSGIGHRTDLSFLEIGFYGKPVSHATNT